jgi:hypothetical protein
LNARLLGAQTDAVFFLPAASPLPEAEAPDQPR